MASRMELSDGLNRMKGKKRAKSSPRTAMKKRASGGYSMTNAHAFRKKTSLRAPLKVAELFAGVGGFHLGLQEVKAGGQACFDVVWGNQWEPSTTSQPAFEIYKKRFDGTKASNVDIAKVEFQPGVDPKDSDENHAPDVDMLVGGFPCQDYSVARTLSQAAGLIGKKGVLWWQIHRFLVDKGENKPAILVFENVDRLLKSPAAQRGRDFAIVLMSLAQLGYVVEWRVINAADYGFPQRRRRVFLVGYHESVFLKGEAARLDPQDWIMKNGVLANAFPVMGSSELLLPPQELGHMDLAALSNDFNKGNRSGVPFKSAGFFREGKYWTRDVVSAYQGKRLLLGDVLEDEATVPQEFYIPSSEMKAWKYLKGAKNEERTNKATGFKYFYTEGPIAFPDSLDKPSRTIITGEGGRSPSRFKHVVKVGDRYRRLMPVELERLNGFPDRHTEGASDGRRAFMMGNALVVGVVERIGRALASQFLDPKPALASVLLKQPRTGQSLVPALS